jgi:wyosine [tRNA(Phe)-imidazoG37] synthetase (radical SAM superfamily)
VLDQSNGEIWAKLDAGTDTYFQRVERSSVPLSRVLENLRDTGRARPIVIQSLFMNLHDVGPDDEEIDAYVQRLRDLVTDGCQIKQVQVYTVARKSAEPWVSPLSDEKLDDISERVRRTGLPVSTFYGPG